MNIKTILRAGLFFFCAVLVSTAAYSQAGNTGNKTKVVAHRGYWDTEGAAQNSLTAFKNAHEIGADACMLDVNMTSDGVLVVCYGPQVGNIPNVQQAGIADVLKVTLENGDKILTLEEFLKAAKKGYKVKQPDGSVKLVKLELVLAVKAHATPELEQEVVSKIAAMVKKMKMESQVQFVSFSLEMCAEAVKQMPGVKVSYLTGDFSPEELNTVGIKGIDYHYSLLLLNDQWIEQAHKLGMIVNVWTVDEEKMMLPMIQLGVDYITTNKPVLVKELIGKHK